ncbi:hypothetical protein KIH39_11275 [Telmatocola sphagniphila]|uniref:MFS transporter n=1 Tax=Telmatocola sphagniphila TaxID=1123043 RepID=A0A8E6BAP4_9BACT|nr:DUF5690 family protein [Telmatocola sphagniphila]QVL34457.1 hypothetical protein KIH39_11275 [Telmatocola sphagniphila]
MKDRLRADKPWVLLFWSIAATFGTYFCMYMFRKPFTASAYEGETLGSFKFKTVIVTSQVLGYTLSKFLGIKIVSEINPQRRAWLILTLISLSEISLILFGLTPTPYNLIFMFFNGLPLGMVFGLVIGFLEGRRMTEVMTAGLCVSFIVAGGLAKKVGKHLLDFGVQSHWMPAVAGILFLPVLIGFVWMLTQIPAPTSADEDARSQRVPLNREDRRAFFRSYSFGLTSIILAFLLITVLRGIRDDFAPEIWKALGSDAKPDDFFFPDLIVGLGVLVTCGATAFLRNNRGAFYCALGLSILGLVLVCFALIGIRAELLSPFSFMVVLGLGLYIPYVAVHTTLFERLIAMTRSKGNLCYLITLSDSFGYLGTVFLMLGKDFFNTGNFVKDFFDLIGWIVAIVGIVAFASAGIYFARVGSAFKEPQQDIAAQPMTQQV